VLFVDTVDFSSIASATVISRLPTVTNVFAFEATIAALILARWLISASRESTLDWMFAATFSGVSFPDAIFRLDSLPTVTPTKVLA
jgi:hypothetical protein